MKMLFNLRAFIITICLFVCLVTVESIQTYERTRNSVVVSMAGLGFSPRKIEVQAGKQITFINTDTIDHWPASNFHPDHTIYPEFDARKSVKPGTSWSFIPKKVGVFKYHDHLFSNSKGTLVVKGDANANNPGKIAGLFSSFVTFIGNINTHFEGTISPERFQKLPYAGKFKAVKAMIKRVGAAQTWRFITKIYGASFRSTFDTHNLAHYMGGEIFAEKGFDGIALCTPLFIYGCYHGFAVRAMVNSLDTIPQMEKGCQLVGAKGSDLYNSCLHGIGHGIAEYFDFTNIQGALAACNLIEGNKPSCQSGVFMEYAVGAPSTTSSTEEAKKKDPFGVCRALDPNYRLACAGRIYYVIEQVYKLTPPEIIGLCETEKDQKTQDSCFEIIGMTAGTRSEGNSDKIMEKCNRITMEHGRALCVIAAMERIAFLKLPNWEQTAKICDLLSGQSQAMCKDRIIHPGEAYR